MQLIDCAALFLPLIGAVIAGFGGHRLGDKGAQIATVSCVSIAALISIYLFIDVALFDAARTYALAPWIEAGGFSARWAVRLDTLSVTMMAMVNIVSALVHIYAVGYMADDKSVPRFMAYLSLFTFFMLALVAADNALQLFFGWEGVGLCSYLLIGFWVERPKANAAAIKAFIVNRVGDFGFLLGLFGLTALFGTLDFDAINAHIPQYTEKYYVFRGHEVHALTALALLFFMGAMAKSAQIGLHVWLPDAMEGPTPVSALIHAATMVTAGVFMLARFSPLYEAAPLARDVVTIVGALSALFAASIAMTQFDIKRVIAYSTISQLGYMVFAAGVSAYDASIFHLVTHAFFKALLFLGAGSVIHALSGQQDMRQMGGLWRKLPFTYTLMVIGSLALTGVFGFSGYYSKDMILHAAFAQGTRVGAIAFCVGLMTAFLTGFYSWRLLLLTFHGPAKAQTQAHEAPWIMLGPLVPLALGAVFVGAAGARLFASASFWRGALVMQSAPLPEAEGLLGALPGLVAIVGIACACWIYLKKPEMAARVAKKLGPVHRAAANRYYFDEIYEALFVAPFRLYATAMRRKRATLDALYDFLFVRVIQRVGNFLWRQGDEALIDRWGADGVALLSQWVGRGVRKVQTGYLYHYALIMGAGLMACVFWALSKGL